VGAILQKRSNDKNNTLKYVTEERQKWRERLRELIPIILHSKEEELVNKSISEIKLRLNPNDHYDLEIVNFLKNRTSEEDKCKIELAFADLLKHDWERAKLESSVIKTNSLKSMFFLLKIFLSIYLLNLIFPKDIEYIFRKMLTVNDYIIMLISTTIVYFLLSFFFEFFYQFIDQSNKKFWKRIKKYLNVPYRNFPEPAWSQPCRNNAGNKTMGDTAKRHCKIFNYVRKVGIGK